MPATVSGLKPRRPLRWLVRGLWLLIIVSVAFFLGVTFVNGEHYRLSSYDRVTGRIVSVIENHERVRVVLWRKRRSQITIENITAPNSSGIFAFLVRPGNGDSGIWVHNDDNANQRFDRGESTAAIDTSQLLFDAANSKLAKPERLLELSLSPDNPDMEFIEVVERQLASSRAAKLGRRTSTSAIPIGFGDVVQLDDPRLARHTGIAGLWRPASVVRSSGLGVYFLEQYDPTRTPVILVHGAAGNALDFQRLMAHLGTEDWQFWLFSYPSGIELSVAAEALSRILAGLVRSHSVPSLSIVAHSMGGLVARAALLRLQREAAAINVNGFVTVATPWNGHPAARWGVKHSPVSLPSWRDMLPDSEFIDSIVSTTVSTPHLLIYGEKSIDRFYLPNRNDGAIGVDSATHQPIVDQAAAVAKFDLDHVSIIQSAPVAEEIARFLYQTQSDRMHLR